MDVVVRLNETNNESAGSQTCTGDARIFSPALYYLSYPGGIRDIAV